MYSQLIAAADPTPFNKPRFISWPSVCDTTRTNWLGPKQPDPAPPSPELQNHVEYATMWGRHFADSPWRTCLPDQRVLAACSSIDCIAPPADPSLTFTAVAAQTWNPRLNLGTWTLDVGPGIPLLTADPIAAKQPSKPAKRRGHPLVFDEVKRAEFIGMLKAGFTIRYAARRVGVSHVAVLQARDRDPLFAARIVEAQRDRDLHCVRRIHNAGKKSWRAAAWILERVEPKEFSMAHKNRDPWTVRGQRRLKKMINEILDSRLADHTKTGSRNPLTDQALRLIEDRLAEIESQCDSYDDPHDEGLDDHFDAPGERGPGAPGSSPPIAPDDLNDDLDDVEPDELDEDELDDDELDDDEPDEDYEENNGYESEEAAVAAYRQALHKLKVRNLDISAEAERWRQQLRKFNAHLRQRRQPR